VPKKPAYQHWQPGKLVFYSFRLGRAQTFSHYMGPAHKRTRRVQKTASITGLNPPSGGGGGDKRQVISDKAEKPGKPGSSIVNRKS
jgi:hypothetical protein